MKTAVYPLVFTLCTALTACEDKLGETTPSTELIETTKRIRQLEAEVVDLKRQLASAKPQQEAVSGPTGVWIISSKPHWVTSSWLDHRSDSWQFLPDGMCILGTATGTYQILPDNRLKVQIPMQAATPGFTAIFTFTVSGTSLTINNLAESEPVVLTRGNPQGEKRANLGPLQASEANRHAVLADIQGIRISLLSYNGANGSYPTSEQGLNALVIKRLMDAVPKDPWGSPYIYRKPGRKNPASYDLFSSGPDQIPDTSDDDWGR